MGLDVYVGTVTRYLTGDWELVTQRVGRELGIPVEVTRLNEPDDAVRDPDVIRETVLAWRELLANGLSMTLEWREDDDAPYFTDKPDWSGYWALLLLAAQTEHPELPLPEQLPENPSASPLLEAVAGKRRRRLFGKRGSDQPARYAALYHPELWLPAETDAIWTAPFVTGDELTMASTGALVSALRDLAKRLDASPDDLDEWRRSGGGGEVVGTTEIAGHALEQTTPGSIVELGRFGLALFLELAEHAAEHRLPVKLDY